MAGYGLRAYLVAQSLNQIEKAYGPNNAILDNCHVRIAFATNDERTARRVSDSLGTATELRAMRNYAGHRLAPWLSHLMISRQEMARPLLTPGEVMQLPPADAIVMVSGVPPIRAKKLRYFEDRALAARVAPPPVLTEGHTAARPPPRPDDWTGLPLLDPETSGPAAEGTEGDAANGGIRREPELPEHEEVVPAEDAATDLDLLDDTEADDDTAPRARVMDRMAAVTRAAVVDRDDPMLPML